MSLLSSIHHYGIDEENREIYLSGDSGEVDHITALSFVKNL